MIKLQTEAKITFYKINTNPIILKVSANDLKKIFNVNKSSYLELFKELKSFIDFLNKEDYIELIFINNIKNDYVTLIDSDGFVLFPSIIYYLNLEISISNIFEAYTKILEKLSFFKLI